MDDIVVGVDPSETARRTAVKAAKWAAAVGVNLHLVTCVDRAAPLKLSAGGETFSSDAIAEARVFLDTVALELPYDRISSSASYGDPAETLCAEAERLGAQTVVVGNRRVKGAKRVLGSVAIAVTRNAPCDVLIVDSTGGA